MGLWQDIKDTYNYHKEERIQQKYFQEQMNTLHDIAHQASVNPIKAKLNALDYRDKMAQEVPQRPNLPERSSWLGRMAASLRFGSTSSGAGRGAEYEQARATFAPGAASAQQRQQDRQTVQAEAQAHNRAVVAQFEPMQTTHQIKNDTYAALCQQHGKVTNSTVNRVGPALMEIATTPAEQHAIDRRNSETVSLMVEYDQFLTATQGNTPIPNPERFQEVSRQMAEKLQPLIAQGNGLSSAQYRADPTSYAWATPDTLSSIKNQYQCFMALADWSKKPENGPAAALAFNTPEAMKAYQVNCQNMAQTYTGLRANAMADMVDPTIQDARAFVHSASDKIAFETGDPSRVQARLADAAQKWQPFSTDVPESTRIGFQAAVETYDPNRNARINPPRKAEPQKLNMDQLGERANVATAPATQRPNTPQQPQQSQKTSAGPQK